MMGRFGSTAIYAWHFYLGDDVQRPAALVGVTFVSFPVYLPELVSAGSLGWKIVLTDSDVVARTDFERDPAVDWITDYDLLTGYWQVGVENDHSWLRITLVHGQLL